MNQPTFNFETPKQLHFVVLYDYTTEEFSIDSGSIDRFEDGEVWDGNWRPINESDNYNEIAAQLIARLKRSQNDFRRPIESNVVRLGRKSPKTSQIAAQRVLPRTGTKRKRVYDLILSYGAQGLCDHEIEQITGWLHQSASSIRNGLMNDGWIKDSGLRRKTPQGNDAIVWVTTERHAVSSF